MPANELISRGTGPIQRKRLTRFPILKDMLKTIHRWTALGLRRASSAADSERAWTVNGCIWGSWVGFVQENGREAGGVRSMKQRGVVPVFHG